MLLSNLNVSKDLEENLIKTFVSCVYAVEMYGAIFMPLHTGLSFLTG